MCGIAGIILNTSENGALDASLHESVRRSIRALAHRGPDAEGIWCGPGVVLAHRRLSIIDLGGGGQPMGNEDGSVQVTFNGEIYNHADLRRELTAKGHEFHTRSDTEVIVHLYEEHGDDLVHKLRGMFAFALWDGVRRRCLLARDRVGLKPLYYYHDHRKLLFGSEVKAILACPDVPREIDLEALEDYLSLGVVTGERSIFRGIRKLPPGHVLTIDQDHWQELGSG
jgi:asparagine synthase (glutamine-hydrolysing)